jgi:DNA-binding LacI/PurR family transcriptional regulator
MNMAVTSRTRVPIKQNRILDQIRGEIVEGKLAPGTQLPTRKQLEQTFQVSAVTLQRALDRLTRDGFIYARGSMGTFVSRNLPFISNYGLVFADLPPPTKWPRFCAALKTEAEHLQIGADAEDGLGPRRFSIYYSDGCRANSVEYRRLLRHIRDSRIAGLIFLMPVNGYGGTPLLDAPNLPRVAISVQPIDNIPTRLELDGLFPSALDYLAARGRKRVALISGAAVTHSAKDIQPWIDGARSRGMIAQPQWIQGVDLNHPQSAQHLAHLLMQSGQTDRPDGLLIGNDTLVEYATAGLIDAGVRVPDDVEVVAHCNFPWPTPSVLPVKRLGYDVRECLRACAAAIDAQRAGQPAPATITIPTRFEAEIVENSAGGTSLMAEAAQAITDCPGG